MCHAQGLQRSDAGEARTNGPSVSSQALHHRATALPVLSGSNSIRQLMYTKQNVVHRYKPI